MAARERAAQLERLAPAPTAAELEAVNDIFRHFIFIRRGAREIWTTCCRQHRVAENATNEEWYLLQEPHTPEPKSMYDNTPQWKKRSKCPYCGKEVTVKEVCYTGSRKNLWSFRRALLLRQWRGALWATAWDCTKDYGCRERWTELPRMRLLGVYRFAPGAAESGTRSWRTTAPMYYARQTEMGKPGSKNGMWSIHSPYGWCNELGMGYDIVGRGELKKSFLRYTGIETVRGMGNESFIELLTAAALYPEKIEWLIKLGLQDAVVDLVERGVKNADLIRWEAERPQDFLRCTRREIREAVEDKDIRYPVEILRGYMRGRDKPERMTVESAKFLYGAGHDLAQRAVRHLRARGVTAEKLIRCLEKERRDMEEKQCSHGHHRISDREMLQLWLDYLDAAQNCGEDTENPLIFLPRGLDEKHHRVTAAWSAIQELERRASESEKKRKARETMRQRTRELTQKYTYWTEEYIIRPPAELREIAREGEKLKHCVGGYADRHLKGQTTILFLRRRDKPGVPLATIEINGSTILQVHGYRNELEPCGENPQRVPARTLYKDILDPWLRWVKNGSKREKNGKPKQKKARRNAA